MFDNIAMTGLGGSGGESLTVGLPQFVALTVVSMALLVLFVFVLWRWDVAHASRLPRGIERQINAFVSSVVIWDFESAERAAADVLRADRLKL